jgi:hypothetical protein
MFDQLFITVLSEFFQVDVQEDGFGIAEGIKQLDDFFHGVMRVCFLMAGCGAVAR